MIDFTESAMELFKAGINAIPVLEKDPSPFVKTWKKRQTELIKPTDEFKGNESEITGIAAIAGSGSGGLEIIDFDIKHALNGKLLMTEYRKQLDDEALLNKLVIQQTISGGYHFLYRCEEIEGNLKLARRRQNAEDIKKGKKEKVMAMIETRGHGGYFVIAPSKGYKIIHGSIFNIPVISIDERKKLFDCAKTFNEHFEEVADQPQKEIASQYDGLSPFEDFRNRCDMVSLLESSGWKHVYSRGDCALFRRPDKDRGVSASYHFELKTFYVHTSSTEFDSQRGYNPAQVYTILKYGNLSKESYSHSSKELYNDGFGDRNRTKREETRPTKEQPIPQEVIDEDDALFDMADADKFLQSLRDGTFENGLSTGMKRMDDHFRFKKNTFVIANGHDNVGKSLVMWFLMLLTAKRYDWRWIVYTGENSKGSFTRRMLEFLYCAPTAQISEVDFQKGKKFIYEHFHLIANDNTFDYKEMLAIIQRKYDKVKCDGVLIDPYNSLDVADLDHEHGYHYKAVIAMQQFAKKNCSLYLNCHAVTGATRKLEDGYVVAPQKSDTEGGTKFASKAFDFLTVHRITNHEFDWMITEIHVRKIKETETGGMPTTKDKPIKLRMMYGNCGFVDEDYYNPVTEIQYSAKDFNQAEKPKEEIPATNWMPKPKEEEFEGTPFGRVKK